MSFASDLMSASAPALLANTIANPTGDIVSTGAITGTTITGTSFVKVGKQLLVSATQGVIGATAGWANPSAHTGFTNAGVVGLPAAQTGSTFVIPVNGLHVGDTITAFDVRAQIESGGNTATLDADLRKLTVAAGDITDASIGDITQISVTADTAIATSKTLATPEVVAATEQFYVVLTGTTAASTDIQLLGLTITYSSV
jgi:hypothetical protein